MRIYRYLPQWSELAEHHAGLTDDEHGAIAQLELVIRWFRMGVDQKESRFQRALIVLGDQPAVLGSDVLAFKADVGGLAASDDEGPLVELEHLAALGAVERHEPAEDERRLGV